MLVRFLVIALCTALSAAGEAGPAPDRSGIQPLAGAGSRLGINLDGIADWNSELPFVDLMHLGRPWISQQQGKPWGKGPELQLDAAGWVQRLEPGCRAEQILLTGAGPDQVPPGDFVLLWQGDGDLALGNADIVACSAGRIAFRPKGQFFVQITRVNAEDPPRDIRVLLPGHEQDHQRQVFRPGFLERWRGFGTLRFMDWMHTNGSEIARWEDYPTPASWRWNRVPVPVMADLCNRLGAEPWFCMPHLADDDFVRRFATQVKELLDPRLRVHVEFSNEVWNGMFAQSRWAEQQAVADPRWKDLKPWEAKALFFAQRSLQVFRIWREVLGRERVVGVLAWQAAGGAYWLDGKLLGVDGVAAETDALAIAPYMTMCVPAKAGKAGGLDAATVAGWNVGQVLDHVETQALPQCIGWMRNAAAVAAKHKVRLLAYEGGQHLVGVQSGENDEAMTRLFHAANRDPRMGALYTRYLDAWKEAGGGTFCAFASCGRPSKWGSWGLMEAWNQPVDAAPKLQAVLAWMQAHPR